MKSWNQMKVALMKGINSLPVVCGIGKSKEQLFQECRDKLGWDESQGHIFHIGGSLFVTKKVNDEVFVPMVERHEKALLKAIDTDDGTFCEDMFKEEMENHECYYSNDGGDFMLAIQETGLTWKDITAKSERYDKLRKAWIAARDADGYVRDWLEFDDMFTFDED